MANPDVTQEGTAPADRRPAFREALAIYLQRRVIAVLLLGFSSGLPLALSGSTLIYWAAERGLDLRTVGLFALVGTPYVFKFLWAPLMDALDAPILGRLLGRRRGWLLLWQLLLVGAIVLVGSCEPAVSPGLIAIAAALLATASATQDIVVDAFRVESLPQNEQAEGMFCYVAGYRVGALVSSAGALYAVSGFELSGFGKPQAWTAAYVVMAAVMLVGICTTLFLAIEPDKSAIAEREHQATTPLVRIAKTIVSACRDFFLRESVVIALVSLLFVLLFKLTDSLAGVMTGAFTIDLGVSRSEYTTIVKFGGFVATLLGGFAGSYIARIYPLATSLWIGGLLQAIANLAFSWQSIVGYNLAWLTFAITVENFTAAIGTVIFVVYLSALCRDSIQTATLYALLTALSAAGRTVLPAPAGYLVLATGWTWFFVICSLAAIPGLIVLALLQRIGHFDRLEPASRSAKS
jgi:MFS transporter, PAT family, beta-lactamase induction signal transducer AmpG